MKRLENTLIFIVVFSIYLAASLVITFNIGYHSQELNIRSGIAYDLLNGNERGREGLICSVWWAPLPTLLQLIFGAFPSLIKSGAAGCILSSIGGALMIFFLFKSLAHFGVWRPAAYVTLLLVAFNPWMLFHSLTGSSEALLLGVLAAALWCLIMWHHHNKLSHLIGLSILASLLPIIRHQAILLSFIILASAIAVSIRGNKPRMQRIEGTIFLALSPTTYTVGLWFLFNWLIMGDFTYFLQGVYLNPVFSEPIAESGAAHLLRSNFAGWASPFFVQFFIMPFLPAAFVLLFLGMIWRRDLLQFVFIGLLAVFPIYHIFMMSRRQSFGVGDDMLISVPISILLAGCFFKGMISERNGVRKIASLLLVLLVITGAVGSYSFITTGALEMPLKMSQGFPPVIQKDATNEEFEIRQFILDKEDDSRIAVAGFCGYNFIRKANGGEEFVHSINLDLPLTLKKTRGKTLYFIVPKPSGAAAFDSINLNLPTLYYLGETTIGSPDIQAHFMLENKDFPNWRIFTIIRPQQNETIFGASAEEKKGFLILIS